MFESAELGHATDKETWKRESAEVRAALLAAQHALAAADFSVVVVLGGVAGAGKSEAANLLLSWLDARGVRTHAFRELTDEEQQRPPMWRYWRALPAKGRIGIFFGGWDQTPLLDAVFGRISRAELTQVLERAVQTER